jgi:hypothetical protein
MVESGLILRYGMGARVGRNAMNSKPNGRRSQLWYLLLILPFVAMFWVSSYNTVEPAWGGVPFFYWYQLLWIPIGAGLTLIVYFATHRKGG